jgi:hypothetical protein
LEQCVAFVLCCELDSRVVASYCLVDLKSTTSQDFHAPPAKLCNQPS